MVKEKYGILSMVNERYRERCKRERERENVIDLFVYVDTFHKV
jgi:hypothetical protein